MKTHEGGTAYEHSLDHHVEFFAKAGSRFTKGKSFYEGDESALSLFQKCWIVDKATAFKLLLWLRDCRGGAGNRSGFRECLKWLADFDPEWVEINLPSIPGVGRWDDMRCLFGTRAEERAVFFWASQIERDVLAAKWADRKDFPLKHILGFKKEGDFRRFLARIRKNHIVEHTISTNRWNEVNYEHVPSVAMSRYTKAFMRHDEDRFRAFKEAVAKGEKAVHAEVLFPHDCVRTSLYGDREMADAQFAALPNYLENTDHRIIVICDTSGSMQSVISGSVQAIHVSQGLALYCSAKISEKNPFHKKFIGFSCEGYLVDWSKLGFSDAIHDPKVFNGEIGSTRIDKALDLLLQVGKWLSATQEQMPTMLLIVSDMQFHPGAGLSAVGAQTIAEVPRALSRWKEAGYEAPAVVYWNLAGYAGSPETALASNVALVSGFSPAILKSILGGDDLTPRGVMLRAIEKYDIVIPE